MTYSIIRPPFALNFREMSGNELEAYREWFHEVVPERILELTKAVNATSGFQKWKPDRTPESLDLLGVWFDGQVELRRRTPEEVEEVRSMLTFPIDVPDGELTNKSFSLAMDIGMYFGEVILKNLTGTRWDQPLRAKSFVDYGQPVIMGFGAVPLNPIRVMVMTAYGISRHQKSRLRELYETWMKRRR